MLKESFRTVSPFGKLLISLFVILTGFLVFFLLSLVVARLAFSVGLSDLPAAMNPDSGGNIGLMKFFQITQSLGMFVVPPLVLAWLFGKSTGSYLGLNRSPSPESLFLLFFIMISALPLINLGVEINSQLRLPEWLSGLEQSMKNAEEQAQKLTELFLDVRSPAGFALNLLMIALIPAIGEELLFRGIVQRLFTEWTKNAHWGVWIAAILFSAMHVQFYGFLPRMLLGALFGYVMLWSGNMWMPVFLHFVNNAATVSLYFFLGKETMSQQVDAVGTTDSPAYWVLLGAFFTAALLYVFYRTERAENQNLSEN